MVKYKTKSEALKAKQCFHCERKMEQAYVVMTIHFDKPRSAMHFPMCSQWCLEQFGVIVKEVLMS